jgi:hypothetical protein
MSSPYISASYRLSLQNRIANDLCAPRYWQDVIYGRISSPTVTNENTTYVMPYLNNRNNNSTDNKGKDIWSSGGPKTPY